MKGMGWLGAVLLLLGVLVLAYPVITYTTSKKVVDLGAVEVTHQKREHVLLPSALGVAATVAGVVLLVVGARGR